MDDGFDRHGRGRAVAACAALVLVAGCGFTTVQDPRRADSPLVQRVEREGGGQFDLRTPPTREVLGLTETDRFPTYGDPDGKDLRLRFLMPDGTTAAFSAPLMSVTPSGAGGAGPPGLITLETTVGKGAPLREHLQGIADEMGLQAEQVEQAVAEAGALRDGGPPGTDDDYFVNDLPCNGYVGRSLAIYTDAGTDESVRVLPAFSLLDDRCP